MPVKIAKPKSKIKAMPKKLKAGKVRVTVKVGASGKSSGPGYGTITWRLQGYPGGKPWAYLFSINNSTSGNGTASASISAPPGKYLLQCVSKSCCPYCKIEGGPINPTVKSNETSQINFKFYSCKFMRCCGFYGC